jgi:hypothetical protein
MLVMHGNGDGAHGEHSMDLCSLIVLLMEYLISLGFTGAVTLIIFSCNALVDLLPVVLQKFPQLRLVICRDKSPYVLIPFHCVAFIKLPYSLYM